MDFFGTDISKRLNLKHSIADVTTTVINLENKVNPVDLLKLILSFREQNKTLALILKKIKMRGVTQFVDDFLARGVSSWRKKKLAKKS